MRELDGQWGDGRLETRGSVSGPPRPVWPVLSRLVVGVFVLVAAVLVGAEPVASRSQEASPASFEVDIESWDRSVVAGEPLEVTAIISNTGDTVGDQTVYLEIGRDPPLYGYVSVSHSRGDASTETSPVADSTRVVLEPGTSERVTLTWKTGPDDLGPYYAFVTTENAFDYRPVSVVEPARFLVDVEPVRTPVTAGAPVEFVATVTNVGGAAGTLPVSLDVGGVEQDSVQVPLGVNASRTVTLVWETGPEDRGTYRVLVRTPDDQAGTSVFVLAPPEFQVELESAPSSVTLGDPVEITAVVTNVGDVTGTQVLTLDVDERTRDSTSLQLEPDQSRTVTFVWQTDEGDRGDHEVTVTSSDDSGLTAVRVLAPADLQVDIESARSRVAVGDSLQVTATVTNVGDLGGAGEVELLVDGRGVDSTRVRLAGGDSQTVRFVWETGPEDRGDHEVRVQSADDSADRTVRVAAPASFLVDIESAPSSVALDDRYEVAARVTNTGDDEASQAVELVVGGTVRDSTTVALAGGASRTVGFVWETGPEDRGDHEVRVQSADDSNRTTVTVLAPGELQVDIESVTVGDPVEVTAAVTNVGDAEASQAVELAVDGERTDARPVVLAGDDSTMVTLSWQPGEDDAGTHELVVSSEDDTDRTSVTVARPANFSVVIESWDGSVVAGQATEVTARVTNTGDEPATTEVGLWVGDGEEPVDVDEVELAGGDSQLVTLVWSLDEDVPTGEHELSVTSVGGSDQRQVVVESPPGPGPFDLSTILDSPEALAVGAAGLIGATALMARGPVKNWWNRRTRKGVTDTKDGERGEENEDDEDDEEEDELPQAVIKLFPEAPEPFTPTLIDGSLSYDPDPAGKLLGYAWTVRKAEESDERPDEERGTQPDRKTGKRFVHVFRKAAEYEVTLEVRNREGETGTSTETVTVEEKAGELELAEVHPDAPGRDHDSLAEEYLVFSNTGNAPLDLAGWTVHDAAEAEGRVTHGKHTFEFGEVELAPEATVTVHTGHRPDDWDDSGERPEDQHCFWEQNWPVWNNEGDIVVVEDPDEAPVLAKRYRRQEERYHIEDLEEESLLDWLLEVARTRLEAELERAADSPPR